jgi:hypothetical protein
MNEFPYSNAVVQNQAVVSATNNSTEVISSNNVVTNEGTTIIHHQPVNKSTIMNSEIKTNQEEISNETNKALELLASDNFNQWLTVPICRAITLENNTEYRLTKSCIEFFNFLNEYKHQGFQLNQEVISEIIIQKAQKDVNVERITPLNKAKVIEAWKAAGLDFKKRPKAKSIVTFDF